MIDTIFVCGCPRSGNTLIGNLLGTLPNVIYTGELASAYFSIQVAHEAFSRIQTPFKDSYRASLIKHAMDFAERIRKSHGENNILCESTPWNVRILKKLRLVYPNALFVFMLRHYSGVIQSLRRSWLQNYPWAGPSDLERAYLWRDSNNHILNFSDDQSIYIGYDGFCASPVSALTSLREQLNKFGVQGDFDVEVLTHSYANAQSRTTIADTNSSGKMALNRISSFDKADWNIRTTSSLHDIVAKTHEGLSNRFRDIYTNPYDF